MIACGCTLLPQREFDTACSRTQVRVWQALALLCPALPAARAGGTLQRLYATFQVSEPNHARGLRA